MALLNVTPVGFLLWVGGADKTFLLFVILHEVRKKETCTSYDVDSSLAINILFVH